MVLKTQQTTHLDNLYFEINDSEDSPDKNENDDLLSLMDNI